ncbi:hypothetical protein QJQ45_013974, partial [Haematococcus lacustris]
IINMRLGNDPEKEDFILLVEDSNRHPALRFLSEYPALVVLAAALLLWAVVKLRRGPSFRGARPSGSSPVPKAVLGGASVDPTRGAQFVHDVRRTQWLEQQQAAYEAQAKQRAEAEEAKRKHAAEAARLQAQQARERREADPVPQPPRPVKQKLSEAVNRQHPVQWKIGELFLIYAAVPGVVDGSNLFWFNSPTAKALKGHITLEGAAIHAVRPTFTSECQRLPHQPRGQSIPTQRQSQVNNAKRKDAGELSDGWTTVLSMFASKEGSKSALWHPPDLCGSLEKHGKKRDTWKSRYFVLKGSNLFWFNSPTAKALKGHIPLEGAAIHAVRPTFTSSGACHAIVILTDAAYVQGPSAGRPELVLSAASVDLQALWTKALQQASVSRPELLAKLHESSRLAEELSQGQAAQQQAVQLGEEEQAAPSDMDSEGCSGYKDGDQDDGEEGGCEVREDTMWDNEQELHQAQPGAMRTREMAVSRMYHRPDRAQHSVHMSPGRGTNRATCAFGSVHPSMRWQETQPRDDESYHQPGPPGGYGSPHHDRAAVGKSPLRQRCEQLITGLRDLLAAPKEARGHWSPRSGHSPSQESDPSHWGLHDPSYAGAYVSPTSQHGRRPRPQRSMTPSRQGRHAAPGGEGGMSPGNSPHQVRAAMDEKVGGTLVHGIVGSWAVDGGVPTLGRAAEAMAGAPDLGSPVGAGSPRGLRSGRGGARRSVSPGPGHAPSRLLTVRAAQPRPSPAAASTPPQPEQPKANRPAAHSALIAARQQREATGEGTSVDGCDSRSLVAESEGCRSRSDTLQLVQQQVAQALVLLQSHAERHAHKHNPPAAATVGIPAAASDETAGAISVESADGAVAGEVETADVPGWFKSVVDEMRSSVAFIEQMLVGMQQQQHPSRLPEQDSRHGQVEGLGGASGTPTAEQQAASPVPRGNLAAQFASLGHQLQQLKAVGAGQARGVEQGHGPQAHQVAGLAAALEGVQHALQQSLGSLAPSPSWPPAPTAWPAADPGITSQQQQQQQPRATSVQQRTTQLQHGSMGHASLHTMLDQHPPSLAQQQLAQRQQEHQEEPQQWLGEGGWQAEAEQGEARWSFQPEQQQQKRLDPGESSPSTSAVVFPSSGRDVSMLSLVSHDSHGSMAAAPPPTRPPGAHSFSHSPSSHPLPARSHPMYSLQVPPSHPGSRRVQGSPINQNNNPHTVPPHSFHQPSATGSTLMAQWVVRQGSEQGQRSPLARAPSSSYLPSQPSAHASPNRHHSTAGPAPSQLPQQPQRHVSQGPYPQPWHPEAAPEQGGGRGPQAEPPLLGSVSVQQLEEELVRRHHALLHSTSSAASPTAPAAGSPSVSSSSHPYPNQLFRAASTTSSQPAWEAEPQTPASVAPPTSDPAQHQPQPQQHRDTQWLGQYSSSPEAAAAATPPTRQPVARSVSGLSPLASAESQAARQVMRSASTLAPGSARPPGAAAQPRPQEAVYGLQHSQQPPKLSRMASSTRGPERGWEDGQQFAPLPPMPAQQARPDQDARNQGALLQARDAVMSSVGSVMGFHSRQSVMASAASSAVSMSNVMRGNSIRDADGWGQSQVRIATGSVDFSDPFAGTDGTAHIARLGSEAQPAHHFSISSMGGDAAWSGPQKPRLQSQAASPDLHAGKPAPKLNAERGPIRSMSHDVVSASASGGSLIAPSRVSSLGSARELTPTRFNNTLGLVHEGDESAWGDEQAPGQTRAPAAKYDDGLRSLLEATEEARPPSHAQVDHRRARYSSIDNYYGAQAAAREQTPLTQPLPNVEPSQPYRAPSSPPPTEITTLPNGVRIVSEAMPGPTSSIGLYVNSGSIYEDDRSRGCSALLECLAFKSSTHRPSLAIMKGVERLGGNIAANASREQMSYTLDCLKTGVPAALELLCDVVLNPKFAPAEVEEQKGRLQALLTSKDIQTTLLSELLTREAYKGALSRPLIPDPSDLYFLTPQVLHDFCRAHYTAPRLVLAASGVDHRQLVELAEPMLAQLPAAQPVVEPTSEYVGGCVRVPGPAPQANLTLAFEYSGGWRDVQGAVAMTVLTYLLGGGNSFSSGGPGKGMHSRLYTRVLNQYYWVHSCTAFNSTYNGSGLVGIQASCDPGHADDMLNVMCRELEAAARSLGHEEVARAKRAAVSIIYNALESKATSAEDIGRQFLTYGHRISGRQYVDMLEAVTPSDISQFVARLLRSKPSLGLFGNGTESVKYEALLARYTPAGAAKEPGADSKVQRVFRMGSLWRSG